VPRPLRETRQPGLAVEGRVAVTVTDPSGRAGSSLLAKGTTDLYQVVFSQPYVYDVLVEVCHASAVADPGEPDSRA